MRRNAPALVVATALAVSAAAGGAAPARRKTGSPLDALPAHFELLTRFGERADFSPDSRRVAFMAKSFGDAFVIDLETRAIRCLTCYEPAAKASVWTLELANDATLNQSAAIGDYNEVEGIFPDCTADEAGVGYGLLLMHLDGR